MVALSVSLLVFKGYYKTIEKGVHDHDRVVRPDHPGVRRISSIHSLAVSWADLFEGLRFKLPRAAVGIAIAAFGLTGVGGDEIMFYNYWCLEKGYAAFTGPRNGTPEWAKRARGWIKVM